MRISLCGVRIDVKKGFDSVIHIIMFDKMYLCNTRGVIHTCFKSCIVDRQRLHNVSVNNTFYNICEILSSSRFCFLFMSVLPDAKIKLFANCANDNKLFILTSIVLNC